jgi:hypothetical protein
MEHDRTGRRHPTSLIRPVAYAAVAALAAALAAGVWWGVVDDRAWQAPLAAAGLAFTAVLGLVWLSRTRAVRRLRAAADAFAEREIARERRRKAAAALPPLRARGGNAPRWT